MKQNDSQPRSLTSEEYAQQALRFATYQNRKDVKCGQDAQAKRDDLIDQLTLAGCPRAEIEEMIGSGE